MKNNIIMTFIFIISLILYSLTLRGMLGNLKGNMIKNKLDQATKPFELSPERGRYLLTLSLAENKSFSLSNELANAAYPDVGEYKGRYYIYFPPGVSILALPLYYLGSQYNLSQVGAFFTISLFAALSLLFLYKIGKDILKLPTWASLFSVLVYGFASTSWSYAITLYQHHITVFFIVSAFYSVWKFRTNKNNKWLWALYIWLAYAVGIWVDYPDAILMLPIMIYFLVSSFHIVKVSRKIQINFNTTIIVTFVVFVLLMILHGYYNYKNFGSWKRLSGSLNGATIIQDTKSKKTANPPALIKVTEANKEVVGFFKEERMPFGLYTLTVAIDRGIFLYSPVFILALFGIILYRKRINWEITALLGIVGLDILLYSSWGDPWGGWAYGPRYLIPSRAIHLFETS